MLGKNRKVKRMLSLALAVGLTLSGATTNVQAVGMPIPETNNINVQKLEYKYSGFQRDDNVESKNDSGHPDVHSEIINDPSYDSIDTVATERDTLLGGIDSLDDIGIQNTGDPIDLSSLQTEYDVKEYSPRLYGDVEFSLFKLDKSQKTLQDLIPIQDYRLTMTDAEKKAFSQSQIAAAEIVGKAIEDAYKAGNSLPYGANLIASKYVNDHGRATFEDVKTYDLLDGKKTGNIYILLETVSPATVVEKARPMFVYLPVTNEDGSTYKNEISLYPKNQMKEQSFGFQKYKDDGDGNFDSHDGPLAGAQFKIYKGRPSDLGNAKVLKDELGQDIVVTTNEKGQLDINGLVRGQYFLVEQEVEGLVDGMVEEANKYEKRQGFKYLAGFDSLLNMYNVLTFHVDSDGLVRSGSDFGQGQLLNNIDLLAYTNHFVPNFEKILKSERSLEEGFDYFENIPFELSFDIPDNIHEYSKFEAKDQLERLGDEDLTSDQVSPTLHAEYVKNSQGQIAFDVVNEKGDKLERDVDYFVKEFDENNKFQISFVNPSKAGMTADQVTRTNNRFSSIVLDSQKIYVRYHAQLNAQAYPDVLYNNSAEFTYNNAPEEGLAKDRYENDGEKFQTFGYRFVKEDAGLFNSALGRQTLEGAHFIVRNEEGLYFNGYNHTENNQGLEEAVWVEYSNDEEAYKALLASQDHSDGVLVSDAEGRFEIRGLKKGDYVAIEMKAPEGYRLDLNPETSFHVEYLTYTNTGTNRLAIQNERAPEMPFTGSEKIFINLSTGILVAGTALSLIYIISSKRRKINKQI